jgi:hypothetical protein
MKMMNFSIVRLGLISLLALFIPAPTSGAPAGKIIFWGIDQWGDMDFGLANVPSGDDFVAIAGHDGHALALRSEGSVAAWGWNYGAGVLGSRDIFYGQAVVPAGLSNVVAIAAGSLHSLALKSDGTVVGWGANEVFGDGDFTGQATVPAGLSNVVAIAAGDFHSLALKSDGSLVAWGDNSENSGKTNAPLGHDFVAISAGDWFNLALKSDGSIVAWGEDNHGQVSHAPTANNFIAIAAGWKYGLALKSDGSLVAWGDTSFGRVPPRSATNLVTIAAGLNHSLALRRDGSMLGWGNNYGFDETDGIYFGQAVPRAGTNYIAIAGGALFSLAIQVQPPALTIGQTGNDLVLSWSTNHIGYNVEINPNLASSLGWSQIPGTPAISGGRYSATVNALRENQFYRLRR